MYQRKYPQLEHVSFGKSRSGLSGLCVNTQVLAVLIYSLVLSYPGQAAERVCEAEDVICLLAASKAEKANGKTHPNPNAPKTALTAPTGDDEASHPMSESLRQDDVIEKTMLSVGADGKPGIRTEWITRRQQEAMKLARVAVVAQGSATTATADSIQPLISDPGCGDNTLWLFDAPGQTGDMLCLTRTSPLRGGSALNWYYRKKLCGYKNPCSWAWAVRSFWAGADGGYFRMASSPYQLEAFNAWQRADSVSSTVANADVVVLIGSDDSIDVNLNVARFTPGPECQNTILAGLVGLHLLSGQVVTCGLGTPHYGFNNSACIYACRFTVRWGETYSAGPCYLTAYDLGYFVGIAPDAPTNNHFVFALDATLSPFGQCIPGLVSE